MVEPKLFIKSTKLCVTGQCGSDPGMRLCVVSGQVGLTRSRGKCPVQSLQKRPLQREEEKHPTGFKKSWRAVAFRSNAPSISGLGSSRWALAGRPISSVYIRADWPHILPRILLQDGRVRCGVGVGTSVSSFR